MSRVVRSISHGDYLIKLTERCSCEFKPGMGYIDSTGALCRLCRWGEVLTADGQTIIQLMLDFLPEQIE